MPKRGSPSVPPHCRSRLLSTREAMSSRTEGAGGWELGTGDEPWSHSPTPNPQPPPSSPRDRFGRLQGETAGEDREAAEEGLLVGREQVVAPGDGVAHRLETGGGVAGTAGEEVQTV